MLMTTLYDTFASLSCISPRFGARLVHAGALTELQRLGRQLEDRGVGNASIREREMDCYATFAQSVPQVSRSGLAA